MFNFFKTKPFNEGYLPKENGHEVYFMEFGNKNGEPVLISHGGPGYFSNPSNHKYFNLKKHRIILFDQRGCGKSKYVDLLKDNTTKQILSDMERLLKHLNINRKITLFGSSWGTTISLLFAEKNPDKVKKIILRSVFLARKEDLKWEEEDSKIFYPEFIEEIKLKGKSNKDFYKMIISNDENKQNIALKYYNGYEFILGSLEPELKIQEFVSLQSARIFLHYTTNNFFIKENQILKNAKTIKNIPTLIVHNRLDLCCPIIQAYELSKALNNSKLVIVPDYGHGSKILNKTLKKEIKEFLA
ncbi:MAG: alpha/beta fold hydrolase [Alphaproteobacteria bacterium]